MPHPARRPLVRRLLAWAAPILATGVVAVAAPPAASPVAASSPPGAVFQAVAPARLADTRQAVCGCTRLDAATIRVLDAIGIGARLIPNFSTRAFSAGLSTDAVVSVALPAWAARPCSVCCWNARVASPFSR